MGVGENVATHEPPQQVTLLGAVVGKPDLLDEVVYEAVDVLHGRPQLIAHGLLGLVRRQRRIAPLEERHPPLHEQLEWMLVVPVHAFR